MPFPQWLLDEEHHRWYGRPWCLGRYMDDFLRAHGLDDSNTVLDVGCGAGRLAVQLVPYVFRYVGVEPDGRSRGAFGYEMWLHGQQDVELYDSIEAVQGRFDVIVDFSVTMHLDAPTQQALDCAMAERLRVHDGRLFRVPAQSYPGSPLRLIETVKQPCDALVGTNYDPEIYWGIYRI